MNALAGRMARTIPEAENFIFAFMADDLRRTDPRVREHSRDHDLYLPWLMEILQSAPLELPEAPPIVELEVLYMDAAWSLVMKGLLRPGPRATTSDNLRDALGKGFALTPAGRERLATMGMGVLG